MFEAQTVTMPRNKQSTRISTQSGYAFINKETLRIASPVYDNKAEAREQRPADSGLVLKHVRRTLIEVTDIL